MKLISVICISLAMLGCSSPPQPVINNPPVEAVVCSKWYTGDSFMFINDMFFPIPGQYKLALQYTDDNGTSWESQINVSTFEYNDRNVGDRVLYTPLK